MRTPVSLYGCWVEVSGVFANLLFALSMAAISPAKVKEGKPHPDPIVESATLASVVPPDITYSHHLQVTA